MLGFFLHQWINKLFSEKIRSPEHCLRLERWQGPPNINKVKQYNTVKFLSVVLFPRVHLQNNWSIIYFSFPPKHPVVTPSLPKGSLSRHFLHLTTTNNESVYLCLIHHITKLNHPRLQYSYKNKMSTCCDKNDQWQHGKIKMYKQRSKMTPCSCSGRWNSSTATSWRHANMHGTPSILSYQ